MAFGGVAIGSIKAQLLAIVTGISTYSIGTSSPMAIPATTGAKTATRATLLISSVIKSIRIISKETVNNILISLEEMADATTSTIPEADIPFAKANPPPNRMRIPQGNFCVSGQRMIKSLRFMLNGIANNEIAAIIEIIVSLKAKPGIYLLIKVLKIHKKMATAKN